MNHWPESTDATERSSCGDAREMAAEERWEREMREREAQRRDR